MFLLLHHRCHCILNSLSCHCGLSLHIILDPFLSLFVGENVRFLSFLRCKLHFGSYAAQYSQSSDPFFLQATLTFIRLMTSSCGMLCQFAIIAHRKWRKVLLRNSDLLRGFLSHASIIYILLLKNSRLTKLLFLSSSFPRLNLLSLYKSPF